MDEWAEWARERFDAEQSLSWSSLCGVRSVREKGGGRGRSGAVGRGVWSEYWKGSKGAAQWWAVCGVQRC